MYICIICIVCINFTFYDYFKKFKFCSIESDGRLKLDCNSGKAKALAAQDDREGHLRKAGWPLHCYWPSWHCDLGGAAVPEHSGLHAWGDTPCLTCQCMGSKGEKIIRVRIRVTAQQNKQLCWAFKELSSLCITLCILMQIIQKNHAHY